MIQVLVVDDDPAVRDVVEAGLTRAGFKVHLFSTGQDALSFASKHNVDLAVVDIVLPDLSGLELIGKVQQNKRVGVIVLSGQDGIADRVVGLEIGADDYLTKPFQVRELVARVRSVLRRVTQSRGTDAVEKTVTYVFDGWRFGLARRTLMNPEGVEVPLTTAEFKLLECFVTHPNRVLGRDRICAFASSTGMLLSEESVASSVKRLRRKLGESGRSAKLITTIRDSGYAFAAKVTTIVD